MRKRILEPHRLRQIPPRFSWVDHRLVGEKRLTRCDSDALALYLFLLIVGDEHGLSYYSDQSISYHLPLDYQGVERAREKLCREDLIAYEHPLYQVLALEKEPGQARRASKTMSVGEVLSQIMKGDADD